MTEERKGLKMNIDYEINKHNPYDQQEAREVFHSCDICDQPIYEDDTYYNVGGNVYCESCVDDGRRTA